MMDGRAVAEPPLWQLKKAGLALHLQEAILGNTANPAADRADQDPAAATDQAKEANPALATEVPDPTLDQASVVMSLH